MTDQPPTGPRCGNAVKTLPRHASRDFWLCCRCIDPLHPAHDVLRLRQERASAKRIKDLFTKRSPPVVNSTQSPSAFVRICVRIFVDALFLQRVHDFLGHVGFVMFGKDFSGLKRSVHVFSGADHALILFKQVRQHANI